MSKDLMCACNGLKCSGICREKNLNRKRSGLADGNKKDRQGNQVWINKPHSGCKESYIEKPKYVRKYDDSDE